jgi:hypothetical protein
MNDIQRLAVGLRGVSYAIIIVALFVLLLVILRDESDNYTFTVSIKSWGASVLTALAIIIGLGAGLSVDEKKF